MFGNENLQADANEGNLVPVSKNAVQLYDKLLFLRTEGTTFNVWPKIVCPAQSATLPTTKKTCKC